MALIDTFLAEDIVATTKREVHIAIRRDGSVPGSPKGDGSVLNPYDGTGSSNLDKILLSADLGGFALPDTRFKFGPGTFRTKGGGGNARGDTAWWPLPGQELIGSGMYSTVLRLELVSSAVNTGYSVIGSGDPAYQRTDRLLISDMTIDVNIANQPASPPYDYARIACVAVGTYASYFRMRRVRIINFGTRTPFFEYGFTGGPDNTLECFPVSLTASSSFGEQIDCVIEDCIIEQPYHSNGRETTCISIGGGGKNAQGRIYNHAPVLRNNLIDCALVNPGPFPKIRVRSLSFSGTEGLLETDRQHDLKDGDSVIISGSAGGTYDGKYDVKNPGGYIDEWQQGVKLEHWIDDSIKSVISHSMPRKIRVEYPGAIYHVTMS